MIALWKTCKGFDRLVVLNLVLLLAGMAAHALPLSSAVQRPIALGTETLATIAIALLVIQLVKTLQSVSDLLRGPQGPHLAGYGAALPMDLKDDLAHLSRARHWLRRGKTEESVREVFGETTCHRARQLNDADDAEKPSDGAR